MALEIFEHLGAPEAPTAIEAAAAACEAAASALRSIAGDEQAWELLAHVLAQYRTAPSAAVVKALEKTASMLGYTPRKATLRG
jgi:hypothetical protein